MSALILGVDSGLDGAFVWMRGGVVMHTLLTRDMVRKRQLDLSGLPGHEFVAHKKASPFASRVAYLETPIRMRGKGEGGVETMFRNDGRIEERLRVLGYEVRRVLPKVWQDDLLDLSKFEVWTEKECKPRLADGCKLTKTKRPNGSVDWVFRTPYAPTLFSNTTRASVLDFLARSWPGAVTTTKSVLSHDTKAASVAYAREHFPGVELVPPRSRNPHDGLADALCIAAWASKKETT